MGDDSSASGLRSLRSVADGASLHMVGTMAVNAIGFLLNVVLTRTLGASIYGLYAYGTMVVTSILTFANFGSDVSLLRYISGNLDDRAYQNRVLGLSYLLSFLLSTLIAVGLVLAAPTINAYTMADPAFVDALRVFAVSLPFQAGTYIASSTVRGLELPVEKTVISVLAPALQLVTIVGAILAGASIFGIAVAYTIACAVGFFLSFVYSLGRTGLRPAWPIRRGEVTDFLDYSAPLTFSKGFSLLFKRVDLFMVGIFMTSADVGVYQVAVLLATVVSMPLAGINQLFPPVASRLHADDNLATLESVLATVTRWSITASIAVALPLFVYREQVLSVFGTEFVVGAGVVSLFLAAQLCNAAAGPANDLLTMTEHQYAVMANHAVFGVLNVGLNAVFIQQFGLIGAALATAGVLAGLNVVRMLEVWYFEGLVPYSTDLWKPLGAASVFAAVMYVAGIYLSGYVAMGVGTAAGLVGFALALYVFGVDERDLELAGEYVDIGS